MVTAAAAVEIGAASESKRVWARAPAELHSGHWPLAVGAEVGKFLAASREFVARVDDVSLHRLGDGQPVTLRSLCSSVEGELGPWDSPTHMLVFIVHGHMRRLVRARAVELVDPGIRPVRYAFGAGSRVFRGRLTPAGVASSGRRQAVVRH